MTALIPERNLTDEQRTNPLSLSVIEEAASFEVGPAERCVVQPFLPELTDGSDNCSTLSTHDAAEGQEKQKYSLDGHMGDAANQGETIDSFCKNSENALGLHNLPVERSGKVEKYRRSHIEWIYVTLGIKNPISNISSAVLPKLHYCMILSV